MPRVLVVAVLVLSLCSSGCIVLAIGSTSHDEQSRMTLDTRVSRRQADISGSLCYVDHKERVISKVTVARSERGRWIRLGAALELVLGGLNAGASQPPERYYSLGAAADGLLALIYIIVRDNEVSTDDSWHESDETASCIK